ncbi:MAG TPA: type II secretion system F family protein [Longimicrobiales bacterium]
MPSFSYRATTADGRLLRGIEEAASPLALERSLGVRGLYPLDIAPAAASARPRSRGFRSRRADVTETVRYLATLLESGFPLDRALAAVVHVAARADVAESFAGVRAAVRGGARLADALAERPRMFPRIAVGMARAGERGGHLAEALARLAAQLEREQALRSRLTSAMLYPAIMTVVGGAALVVLVGFVLPRFVALLGDAGAAVPRSTALLLAIAAFVGTWWPALLVGGITCAALAVAYRRTPAGRRRTDTVLLRLPIVGALRQRAAAARLGRALATLLGAGLPIVPALDIGAETLADEAVAAELRRAREEVRAGGRLAAALGRGGAFPFLFLQMVEMGEESGRLPALLDRAAAGAEQELERNLERLVRLAEPAMILIFGGIIGFVALALLQAIYGVRVDAF